MSEDIKDGGPAFPMPASEHSQGGHFEQNGMSLRDWFAGQALVGFCSACTSYGQWTSTSDSAAAEAYAHADAMLKAREAKP